jgi:hypothetical protein
MKSDAPQLKYMTKGQKALDGKPKREIELVHLMRGWKVILDRILEK